MLQSRHRRYIAIAISYIIATLLRCVSILIGRNTKQTPSGDVKNDGKNCMCCAAL